MRSPNHTEHNELIGTLAHVNAMPSNTVQQLFDCIRFQSCLQPTINEFNEYLAILIGVNIWGARRHVPPIILLAEQCHQELADW